MPAPPTSPGISPPAAEIASALSRFGRKGCVRRVFRAQKADTPPPPLAYLVHFPRLSVTLSGREAMWLEQEGRARLVELGEGDAVFVPPDCWNRPVWSRPSTTLNVLFGQRQVGLSLVRFDGGASEPPAAAKVTVRGAVEEVLRGLCQALESLPFSGARESSSLLVESLLCACRELLQAPSSPARRKAEALYDSVCMYVQEHFQFALTRESVADYFRVSPTHVSRLFRREGSVAFNDYVNYVRINRAKHLLRQYRQTVDEVAVACGFSDASYFCRIFKKMTRLTPSAYRQQSAPGA